MDNIRKKFNEYAKKFDLKNNDIMRKYHHSYRVMEYSKDIAESLNLTSEEIRLTMIIGLLHDISRFKQWTLYETYDDLDSFDHGDMAVEIIEEENILENEKEKDIILMAIKNHNKYEIEEEYKDNVFAKIIRDADKIDIMREQGNSVSKNHETIDASLLDTFFNNKLTKNGNVKNEVDVIVRMLTFVYDFNFEYTYKFVEEKDIIKNKFNLLINYCDDKQTVNKMENIC